MLAPSTCLQVSAFTAALSLAWLDASAQDIAQADAQRSQSVALRLSVAETFSSIDQQAEFLTQISPGIRINLQGARVKTAIDYAMTELVYARQPQSNQSQQALTAFGNIEAVENRAFIDFTGSISQQTVSALGTQSLDTTVPNPNRTEVSSYRISPFVRGSLGHVADYDVRWGRTVTGSDSAIASGSTLTDTVVKLSGTPSFNALGWTAEFNRQTTAYRQGRTTQSNHLNMGLLYPINAQIELAVKAGRESSNFTTESPQTNATHSVHLNWTPSELTSLSLTRSRRSFGDAFDLLLTHRSGRTVWRLTDSRDLASAQTGSSSAGSMYDLLFAQFASAEPDPVARARRVEDYLQTNGISASMRPTAGFLTSALTLQRTQQLSFALLGIRDTITFTGERSSSRRLDTLSASLDDLAGQGTVRQQGFGVQYTHRLSPDYALGLVGSEQKMTTSSPVQGNRLRSLDISLKGRLSKKTTISLTTRRALADSTTASSAQTAITGWVNLQF